MSNKPVAPSQLKGGNIYDRLSNPATFHASHRERFDQSGHGLGKAGRDGPDVKDLSQMTRSEMRGTSVMVGTNSNRTEEARLYAEKKANVAPVHSSAAIGSAVGHNKVERPPSGKPVPPSQIKGGSIYDRLSNPATFHASHRERFDQSGHGLGKAGRDGPDVKDLSQMTRSEMRGTSVMVGTNSNRAEESRLKSERGM